MSLFPPLLPAHPHPETYYANFDLAFQQEPAEAGISNHTLQSKGERTQGKGAARPGPAAAAVPLTTDHGSRAFYPSLAPPFLA